MKIAVTCENDMIFQHFGKTKIFTLYDIEDNKVISKVSLDCGDNGHSALVDLLEQNKVDMLICGGIGAGAKDSLKSHNINYISGAIGNVDDVIKQYISGKLHDNPLAECTHHEHGKGHSCND